jgi:hypothetical protein
MAIDFVSITKTSRPQLGSQVIGLANQIRDIRDKVDALNDAASHMHDGANYALVESQFGLTGGAGANFVTLLGLLNTIMNTNGDVTGANRLAQLDEFVARIAGQ